MTNQELELKIKELSQSSSIIDAIEGAVQFEPEYKKTNFYKKTKMPLMELLKQSRVWYTFDWDTLMIKVQKGINELDVTKINGLIDEIGTLFSQENQEIMGMANTFADLLKPQE